ncbi:MAG TPA: hypothetical protein VES42_19890 [Pilimelia sp.]|nr:hypothetical protein [Pilimelia sp.]
MALTPQPSPLWLAQVVDNEVQAGRVISWIVGDLSASNPDASSVAQPIVVFADDDGFVWATMPASRTAPRFVGDTRDQVVGAAGRWVREREKVAPAPAGPP